MRILIASPEATPYAKTGGLADVAGALLKEFSALKQKASLVLPLYRKITEKFSLHDTGKSFVVAMGSTRVEGRIWTSETARTPGAYFIECEELYGRKELYGTSKGDYRDNALRFAFFSRAVIETCLAMDIRPDLIHCNDWQTGMVPLYLRYFYADKSHVKNTATLYTVHNLGYQGLFPPVDISFTGLGSDYFTPDRLEFYGRLNFMKAGLLYADLLNTVSKTYAREILDPEYGFGLEGVLRMRKHDLYGVINGLDYEEWDPAHDRFVPRHYSEANLADKALCKKRLMEETGLRGDRRPLLGVVSRFSSQKGLDLLANSLDRMVRLGVNVVVLGKGDEYYQDLLSSISGKHPGRVFVKVGFRESLAHIIYAGCDFFLMPSKYEPCGLGQLIALRYGTIPVARNTGGLADTIEDYDHLRTRGTGFLFSGYTPASLLDAIKRALCVYTDEKKMRKLVSGAMKTDFSWRKSAEKYLELYGKALRKVVT
ncbi:MAG: glycogen synthase GlgA [Candidatus Sulfobium sp.]|jgi:starch synthase